MKWLMVMVAAVLSAFWTAAAYSQDSPPPDKFVTRQEHEAMKAAMMKELEAMKAKMAAMEAKAQPTSQPSASETEKRLDDLEDKLAKTEVMAAAARGGTTKLLIAGDADFSFSKPRKGASSFGAGAAPLLLWEIGDRLLVEAAIDMSLAGAGNGASTEVELALANFSYKICDYLVVGGGRFTVPFGIYHTRLDPSWINKLPDDPLPFGDRGIAPDADLGVFASGVFPIGPTKLNYAVYVTNGPTLITDDPNAAGSLSFDNFDDPNNGKAVGGRIGFQPFPWLEVGYSIQGSESNPAGFQNVNALLQAVDLMYAQEFDPILGKVTVWAEEVWSHVGDATYDPTGIQGFGPLRFNNNRNGGFVQVAYRPTKVKDKVLRNFEFVLQYDWLDVPAGAPDGGNERRLTPGIAYWLSSQTVVKVAYECDQRQHGDNNSQLLFQFGTGF